MLSETLKERLVTVTPDITIVKSFWEKSGKENRLKEVQQQIDASTSWNDASYTALLKERERLKEDVATYHSLIDRFNAYPELINLYESDQNGLEEIAQEVGSFCKEVARFKVHLLLSGEQDNSNCFFSINSGAGGTESQDWAEILLRMYVRFCEREKMPAELIDYQAGEGAGIKSATLFIKGAHPYGLLKCEEGVHRLVRISPFDTNKRRHTSFASVTVTPEVPEISVQIDQKDLRIDTYRASGAGGQHVNKTESAVRITHIPTNTVVQCQIERSQIQNRETAMKMLIAKLAEKQRREQEAKLSATEKKKIEWGSQIRSYVLHPYKMIKDHRTDFESMQPDKVLDGELMPFIEAYLIKSNT